MKSKRVWGYKAMCKDFEGRKGFWYKRYTPMEMEIEGVKIWYEPEDPRDLTEGFRITDAKSGILICNAKCSKVKEIPDTIHKPLQVIKRRQESPSDEYKERTAWFALLMEYIKQFESPNKHNVSTPPEEIEYKTEFETWSAKNVHS